MIGISETWINNDNESLIHLPGYSFVNINRKTKSFGGVGMFIPSALTYRVRNDLNLQKDDIIESIFIETYLKENDKIITDRNDHPRIILMTLKQN